MYTAPPQVSLIVGPIAIGPLPMTEGTASASGLSRGVEAQASVRTPLGAGWQASLAAYYRDTDYAVDFGMLNKPFTSHVLCADDYPASEALVVRHVDTRAMGIEAMIRRDLGHSVTGWLSYSLGEIDRDLGFVQLPHDYDQRHTLNATAQWRYGRWRLGASGNVHTGRPVIYPQLSRCPRGSGPVVDVSNEPTSLRRLPTTWRVDLRAERELRFSGWNLRVYAEMQNASLTKEVLGYELTSEPLNASGDVRYRVAERTLFIPVPIVGMEVDL
jgi:outer membrane receptor protein involved in Fe transport